MTEVRLSDKMLWTRQECYKAGLPANTFKEWYDQGKLDRAIILVGKKRTTEMFNRLILQDVINGMTGLPSILSPARRGR